MPPIRKLNAAAAPLFPGRWEAGTLIMVRRKIRVALHHDLAYIAYGATVR